MNKLHCLQFVTYLEIHRKHVQGAEAVKMFTGVVKECPEILLLSAVTVSFTWNMSEWISSTATARPGKWQSHQAWKIIKRHVDMALSDNV